MQLLSGIAHLLTRPPSTTDHRSDPAANPDNFASHGGEEVEDLEGTSGARTGVTSNVRRGNSSVSIYSTCTANPSDKSHVYNNTVESSVDIVANSNLVSVTRAFVSLHCSSWLRYGIDVDSYLVQNPLADRTCGWKTKPRMNRDCFQPTSMSTLRTRSFGAPSDPLLLSGKVKMMFESLSVNHSPNPKSRESMYAYPRI